ncbi:MAG TPA: CRTAC1 family protein, partial [Rhodothermales bacterium]|nr:CRTAC1 family protein [Rhodothermales bacterium]
MQRTVFIIVWWLAFPLFWVGCSDPEPRLWHEEVGYRWIDLPEITRGDPGFEQMAAAQTGLDFANRVTGEQVALNRHRMHGSGVAVGDVDGDGLPDIYFARLDGPNVLYRNLGDWRFEDITDRAGVAAPNRFSTGVTFADIDGDDDLDLLVTALGGPNAAFLNDGKGHFQEVTQAAGLASSRGSTTMALADVDSDGDLDLYVANYKRLALRDSLPPDQLLWDNVVRQDGDTYTIAPAFQDHYNIEIRGTKVLRLERGEPDRFYLNDGAGHFSEASFTGGRFLDADGQPLTEVLHDWALMARFQDFNDDGVPDLYVCNDFESPDHFWLGDSAGGFRMAPRLALRKTSSATMAVAVSDIDRDGVTDFFLADMLSPEYTRRQRQAGTQVPVTEDMGVIGNRPQVMQNTLFRGQGDGTFAEVAQAAGVAASEWTWSSVFLDVDLDGYEDLLIANGHLFDVQDADAQLRERMQIRQTRSFDAFRRLILHFPPLALKNMAFRNLGGERFETMPDGWGLGIEADVSHGMALGDLDGDGDQDVVINRLNQEAGLFQNLGSAPRVAVRLRGLAPNTQGIGAKVRVRGAGLPMQQEMIAGGQYLSSSEPLLTFAAADEGEDVVDSFVIEVDWRGGRRSRITGVRGNRLYEIDEAAATESVAEDSTQAHEQA